jgi:CBS-domain-containing membrane protein
MRRKTMQITVRDVMSSQIVAVRRRATFKEMAARLREYRISGFPVIDDDGQVIGVVSEADLLALQAGHPEPAHVGDELADAIRHVRGVVAVRDEFGYPPAESSFVPGLYF